MGIQINGNTNNINAGIGSLSIEDINELDIVGVATAANFKTGVSNLHSVGLTLTGGQIDVGSNIKIGTAGVITATSFSGAIELSSDTSPQLGGNLDCNNKNISLNDSTGGTNNRIKIGTNDDLQLWHNSSTGNSNVSNYNGDLYIQGNNGSGTGVNQIAIKSNAAVELNYQGTKKFETIGTGVKVSSSAVAHLKINSGNNSSAVIHFGNVADDDMAQIWYDDYANSMYFRTSTNTPMNFYTNGTSRLILQNDGHLRPSTDSNYDLGTNSVRFRNVYADTLYGDGSNLTGIDATADRITEGNSYAEVLDTGTNGIFRFVSEGAERFRVTHDGLFGVGTNNPTYSGLFGGSQEGMVITGSTAPFLRITSSTSNQGDLILQAGNSGADVQMGNLTAGGDIVFWNKPTGGSLTERFRIKEDGHAIIAEGLGVGGQDPGGSTLRVHGSIYASLGGNTSWQKLLLEGSNNTAGDALSINNWGDAEGDYWGLMVNQTMNQSGNYSKTNSGKRTSYITIDGRMGRVYLGGASTSGNPTEHFYTNWNGSIYADADYGSPRAMYPCRAWANLSGDSSPATIRVSRGLSGVTDLGTGDYRFTFSSAMTDNNYSALCSSAGDAGWSMVPHIYSHNDMTTTTVRFSINAVNVSGQNYDRDIFCMAIFR